VEAIRDNIQAGRVRNQIIAWLIGLAVKVSAAGFD